VILMKWITTNGCMVHQIIKGRSNSYLVMDNNISILVDTGMENSRKELIEKLDDFLGEKRLSYLVLTHVHYDHVGNAATVKKRYDTKIIIQKKELEYLREGASQVPSGTNFITHILVALAGRISKFSEYEKVQADFLVDDEYILSPNCYLMHTPGHTDGSMSLIVDGEVALVGDAMFGVFNWSVFPPFADDVPTMIKSWRKLLKTGCHSFLPGHGTKNSRELLKKQYDKYKKRYMD